MSKDNLRDGRVKNWFYLENDLLDRQDLTIYEKMIYIVIARYVDKEDKAFPSVSTIAKKGSMSERQVQTIISSLVKKGLIKREPRINKGNYSYILFIFMILTLEQFRKKIELSLVNQYLSNDNVHRLCLFAKKLNISVICVNPVYVKTVKNILQDTDINISANVGFPFGTNLTEVKVLETKRAITDGANQIDMVINVGALKSNNDLVLKDINEIVKIFKNVIVKTIIET